MRDDLWVGLTFALRSLYDTEYAHRYPNGTPVTIVAVDFDEPEIKDWEFIVQPAGKDDLFGVYLEELEPL